MLQLAGPSSPANSTRLHLARVCIKPEQLPLWTSPPNGTSPWPASNIQCATPRHDLPHGRGGLPARRQQKANPNSTWPEANHLMEPRSDGHAPLGAVALPEPSGTHSVDPVTCQEGEKFKHRPPCQELVAQVQVLSWSWSQAQCRGLRVWAREGRPGSQGHGRQQGPYLALRR